jgi:hypothetical protein
MARNRVIYQSEALFVSDRAASTGVSGHRQLERVQSANFSYTINRQDINQFGELARIDSVILDPPTVSADFSYYLTDGLNEAALGFYVSSGVNANYTTSNFASGQMVGSSGANVFIATSPEGIDINTEGSLGVTDTVIGIGNCYLTDYSVDMSVGSIPTASVSMEGANIRSDNTIGADGLIDNPAVDQEAGTALTDQIELPSLTTGISSIAALRPGDITVQISDLDGDTVADLSGVDGAHVQSVSISAPFSRTPLDRLGSRFPFAREVDFPINVSMSISAIVNETTAYQLADKLDAGAKRATVTLKDKAGDPAIVWTVSGAKVDSESFSTAIGSNQSVDLTLSAQVGGINDVANGLFMSGANNVAAFHSV